MKHLLRRLFRPRIIVNTFKRNRIDHRVKVRKMCDQINREQGRPQVKWQKHHGPWYHEQ